MASRSKGLAVALATCLALAATEPLNAETLGQIGLVVDGEATGWITESREIRGKLRHSATLEKGKLFDTIELTGNAEAEGSRERLKITMIFSHGPIAKSISEYGRPTDTTIIRLLGDVTGPRWEARDIGIDFAVTERSETEADLTGTFQGVFCYHEEIYADPKEDSCRPGTGEFETVLVIERDD